MSSIAQLEETLGEAVTTGKIGTVVSIRALLHLPGEQADLETAASVVLGLAGRLIGSDSGSLVTRGQESGRQLNLLVGLDVGGILSVSVTRGSSSQVELVLVVVGNHGVIRLEGAELAEEMGLSEESFAGPDDSWLERISGSVNTGTS
ncbi:MAG TPA: hypothetical protein DCE43_08760 [Planctomycetaceae bacterium]|jgi:hypothetical protein|nr:hypothetical protein [Planctomycetaceae bacterium]HAA49797.1 hypothetical protein [Planctomycetaceae bacterium]HCK54487.1 hypothetical protein [Planctomycetaceae bacterium]|tara:strand:- start:815 stop:1258 length:444 start_codon:yes stop_codon:yes gene_type:complete